MDVILCHSQWENKTACRCLRTGCKENICTNKHEGSRTRKTLWTGKFKQERPSTYEHNIKAHLCNHCFCWKVILTSYSESVSVPIDIQHAEHMRRFIISGLSGSTIFFPHYLKYGTILGKKVTELKKMYVFIFSITFVWNISHSKKNWAR